uniref:Uncharacterized protein n=1 Tax=Anguilla anguilla TaxID=7936 RepID=A0A0E9Y0J3_ANGAN
MARSGNCSVFLDLTSHRSNRIQPVSPV